MTVINNVLQLNIKLPKINCFKPFLITSVTYNDYDYYCDSWIPITLDTNGDFPRPARNRQDPGGESSGARSATYARAALRSRIQTEGPGENNDRCRGDRVAR